VHPRVAPDAGFGVVELVIVAALISTLAVLSVPSIAASRNGYELITASTNVAGKVAEARTNALKRNRNTWVLVTPATRTIQVQTTGGLGAVDINNPETLPARVVIDNPAGPQPFAFDTLGRPVDGAGILAAHVIQLRHTQTGLVRTVSVGTTGRVTIN
jgi:Tfp pilus assembly protein FimT